MYFKVCTESGNLRARESPALDSPVRDRLIRGQHYESDDQRDGWAHFPKGDKGVGGWGMMQYLEEYEPPAPQKPTIVYYEEEIRAVRDYCNELLNERSD